MKIDEAVALRHDGVTANGQLGYHVLVIDEEVHEIDSEQVRRYASTCLVRWWPETGAIEPATGAWEGFRAWERSFEIDREPSGSFHIAWGFGDDYPPAELTKALYTYVGESLAGPRE